MTDRHTLFLYLLLGLAVGNMLLTATLATPEPEPEPVAERPAESRGPVCPGAREIAAALASLLQPEIEPASQDPIQQKVRDMRQHILEDFQRWRKKARELRQQPARPGQTP